MAEILLQNGKFLSMAEHSPELSNILIRDGVITAVNVDAAQQDATDRVTMDLKGGCCLPGFHDSHMHLVSYGFSKKYCIDLSGATSIAHLQTLVRNFICDNRIAPGQWVMGTGWNQAHFTDEQRMPTAEDLDHISTEHFLFLRRICIHIAVVNTRLLEHCDLTQDTFTHRADIGRRDNGTPDGRIYEAAISDIVLAKMPPLSTQQLEEIILCAAAEMRAKGLTMVQTDDMKAFSDVESKENILNAYDRLRQEQRLPIRIYEQIQVADLEELRAMHRLMGRYRQDEWLSMRTIKLILDGSLGAGTAALGRPYLDAPDCTGLLNYTDETLAELVDYCYRHDLQVMCHVIGDRALAQAVRVIGDCQRRHGKDLRPRFVHVQIATEPLLRAIGDLGGVADIQPSFVASDYQIVPRKVSGGPEARLYAWKSMKETGVFISGSSDCPIEDCDPLSAIQVAVTRQTLDGLPPNGWQPQERLSTEEALALFTSAPAHCIHREDRMGKLLPGYWGDLVILDRNPLEVAPAQLSRLRVVATLCAGKPQERSGST